MPYCPSCGGEVADSARFCTHCGAGRENPSPSPSPAQEPASQQQSGGKKRGCLKWGGIGCGGLLAIMIAIVIIAAITSSGDGGGTAQSRPPGPTPTFQEAMAQATRVSYDDLFRNNAAYIGQKVHFQGKIIQVVEGPGDSYDLRVNVTQGQYTWDDTVYLRYSGPRLLEDDIIEFVGEVEGLRTYEAVFGNNITIPELAVIQSRLVSKG